MDIREKIKERMTEKVIRSKFLKKLYFSFWKIVLFFLAIIVVTNSSQSHLIVCLQKIQCSLHD